MAPHTMSTDLPNSAGKMDDRPPAMPVNQGIANPHSWPSIYRSLCKSRAQPGVNDRSAFLGRSNGGVLRQGGQRHHDNGT